MVTSVRRSAAWTLVLMCLVLWPGVAFAQAPAPEYVGYVVRVTGKWTLQTSAHAAKAVDVAQWQEVPAGSRLVPADGSGQVSVLLIDGRTVVLDGAKPDTWKAPIALASTTAGDNNKWIRLVMRWLAEKPQVVVPAMARGPKEVAPLLDRIVEWAPAGIDPAMLLGSSVQQPLVLRFETLTNDGGTAPGDPAIVDWDPSAGRKPAILLRPALYRMIALDPEGASPGREAWILLVKPAEFARAARLFQNLVQIVGPLAKDDPRSGRGFLRAALLALANDSAGS